MAKRWLIMMTPDNVVKCENGTKTNTRRTNARLAGIKTGDEIYYRSNYKTTYKTASGPYLATEDARWENLQDISEEDAKAEGCHPDWDDFGVDGAVKIETASAKTNFILLWDSIYAKKGQGWEKNLRVLRIAFKKL